MRFRSRLWALVGGWTHPRDLATLMPCRGDAARRLKELNGEMDSTAIIKRSDLIRFQRHSLSLSVELHLHLQKMPRYHIFCLV